MKSTSAKLPPADDEWDTTVYFLHLVVKLALEDPDLPQDPEEYVEIEGRIMYESEEQATPAEAGKVVAHLIGLHRGAEIGDVAYESTDEDIEPLHACLFDRYGRMRPYVARVYGASTFVDSLLYVESIEVALEHRGQGVGLRAMKALLRHFAPYATLACCKPYRIYAADDTRERDPRYVDPALIRVPKAQAAKALARYWAGAGFKKLGRGPYYIANLKTLPQRSAADFS